MRKLHLFIRHVTNPLYIYCRLMDIGFSSYKSKQIGGLYEKWLRWIRNF
uniref:Uncharacterized protein n=1 Tax=viral metagenome TaxID=1070528 RepID=A0A6H1ZAK4_9ZZZZ